MTLHLWARLPLFPLLLAQGMRVRRTALILPEPPGDRQGQTAGVGALHQDQALAGQLIRALSPQPLDWRLVARTGATSAQTLRRLEQETRPIDAALVALGVNDVTRAVPLSRWIATQIRLIAALRARGARRIVLTAVPPMHRFPALPQPLRWVLGAEAARFNHALKRLAERENVTLLVPDLTLTADPVAKDGFHPAPAAYALWADAAAALLRPDASEGTDTAAARN